MAHDIFISYAAEDRSAAEAARAALEAQGMSCWIAPRDVLPGKDETESILAAIDASSVVVLCLSSAANASKLVTQQAAHAFNKHIPIVPLRIEDVEPSHALKLFFGTQDSVDAYVPPLEVNLPALIEVVRLLLTKTVASAAGVLPPLPPHEEALTLRKRGSSVAPPRNRRNIVMVAALAILACIIVAALLISLPQAQLQPIAISSETSKQTPSPTQASIQGSAATPTSSAGSTPTIPTGSTPIIPQTPSPKIATTIRVWAGYMGMPALWLDDPQQNPVKQGSTQTVRYWIDAADSKHPCGAANYYIDNSPAGGKWDITQPQPQNWEGCPGGLSGGAGGLTLAAADTAKLSVGSHTLKIDYLGNETYAPSEYVGQFLVNS